MISSSLQVQGKVSLHNLRQVTEALCIVALSIKLFLWKGGSLNADPKDASNTGAFVTDCTLGSPAAALCIRSIASLPTHRAHKHDVQQPQVFPLTRYLESRNVDITVRIAMRWRGVSATTCLYFLRRFCLEKYTAKNQTSNLTGRHNK